MNNLKPNKYQFLFICISIVLIDQYTKLFISNNIDKFINKKLFVISIDYVRNYGAAFNIFDGNRIFLSIISLSVSLILIYLIFLNYKSEYIVKLSYSFILGGTMGNGIDRFLNGFVIDFIKFNSIKFPVFNIADISINIGFIILFYCLIRNKY